MKRQPEGIPTGGQFAADRKAEPASSLPHVNEHGPAHLTGYVSAHRRRERIAADLEAMDRSLRAHAEATMAIMARQKFPNAAYMEVQMDISEGRDGGQIDIVGVLDADGEDLDTDDAWTRQDGADGVSASELTRYLQPTENWTAGRELLDPESGNDYRFYTIALPGTERPKPVVNEELKAFREMMARHAGQAVARHFPGLPEGTEGLAIGVQGRKTQISYMSEGLQISINLDDAAATLAVTMWGEPGPWTTDAREIRRGRRENDTLMIALGSKEKLSPKEIAEKFLMARSEYEKSMQSSKS